MAAYAWQAAHSEFTVWVMIEKKAWRLLQQVEEGRPIRDNWGVTQQRRERRSDGWQCSPTSCSFHWDWVEWCMPMTSRRFQQQMYVGQSMQFLHQLVISSAVSQSGGGAQRWGAVWLRLFQCPKMTYLRELESVPRSYPTAVVSLVFPTQRCSRKSRGVVLWCPSPPHNAAMCWTQTHYCGIMTSNPQAFSQNCSPSCLWMDEYTPAVR